MLGFFLRVAFVFLSFSAWARLIFLVGFDQISTLSMNDIASIFWMGARFDLMVFAYLTIPVMATAFIGLAFSAPHRILIWQLNRFYYVIAGIAVALVTIVDFWWTNTTGDRLNQTFDFELLRQSISWSAMMAGMCIAVMFITWHFIRRVASLSVDNACLSNGGMYFVCVILLVLAARGTLEPHHLDLTFANVTGSAQHDRAVVPSAYALDQALRGRR